MLICTVCMTRKHKKHDVVDVDENRKEELLENLTSAIETLSCWEEQIDAVQITVETKNEESLRKLREDKKRTLIMVGKMYDSLIDAVATQAEEFSSRNGNKMTSLKENLLLLNHMKLHMEPETVSQRDVENYQETRDNITEQTHRTLFGAGSYEYLEYAENNEKERFVKLLCGELTRKDCTPAPAKITEQGRRAKNPTNLVENQETSPSPPALPNFKRKSACLQPSWILSKGDVRDARPLSVQFLSFSCSFRQKSCQIIDFRPNLWVDAPRSGESWIRH